MRVTPGAFVGQWGGGQSLPARVRVEPSRFLKVSALGVEERRVNVIIDFVESAAAAALGDGYRVEVRIVFWQEDDVVKVPISALFRRGEEWAVFLVEDDCARLQSVQFRQRNDIEDRSGQVSAPDSASCCIRPKRWPTARGRSCGRGESW